MARHQIVTRLGRFFNVVWCDFPKEWREYWLGPSKSTPMEYGPPPDVPGFSMHMPGRWLPLVHRPRVAALAMERGRTFRARQILFRRGVRRFVAYLWRPGFAPVLDHAHFDVSCYHIDDEYSFSPVDQPNDEEEIRLIRRVDEVIVHSPALAEKKGGLNPRTTVIPNGVDYGAFSTPQDEPGDLAGIPHPRIGYVGYIKTRLDMPLMAELATRHPEYSFVFVGPSNLDDDAEGLATLRALSNVWFLGQRPVDRLPCYVQHINVCVMPYVMDGYTKYIYPLKLHEYLAAGRPVVGRPIRSLQDFAHVIHLATTVDEWSDALSAALSPSANSHHARATRQGVARLFDWDPLALKVARVFCGHFGGAVLDRLEEYAAQTLEGSERPGRECVADQASFQAD